MGVSHHLLSLLVTYRILTVSCSLEAVGLHDGMELAECRRSDLNQTTALVKSFNVAELEQLFDEFARNLAYSQKEDEVHFSLPIWSILAIVLLLAVFTLSNCLLYSFLKKQLKLEDAEMMCKEKQQRKKSSGMINRKMSLKSVRKLSKIVLSRKNSTQQITADPEDEVAAVMAMNSANAERDLDQRIEMPMNEEEFMLAMKKEIEFIVDYYRNPAKLPVSPDIRPNDIFNQLPQKAPENPEKFDLVWSDFNEIILKGCIQWQHPRFHAFFPCGRSYPDILAETLISSLGTVGITWAANPAVTELDGAMVNWLGRALGIPETFLFQGTDTAKSEGGGWLADTASDAIFCAMMAARHCTIEKELAKLEKAMEDALMTVNGDLSWRHEMKAEIMSKLVAYGSYEGHSSFEKACKMACVRHRHIEVYAEDDWGMRRESVERKMEKDIQNGLIPFYLHVALGTTSTASSDHLAELVPLRKEYNLWIHVDAAYAGSAWVVEKYRNNEGIDQVDSINVNLHKFFLTSASITPFWTRHQRKYKEFFHVQPAYLKKTGGNDLRDWGIQLTRRFKSLKVFMLLRVYGLNGMRAYVERIIGMTEYMETLVVKIPNIRKFGRTNYGLFCVQYHEEGMSEEEVNAATKNFCDFINNSRQLYFTHSNVRGHDIIRVAVTLERSTKKDVEESVEIYAQLVKDFRMKNKEMNNNTAKGDAIIRQSSASSSLDDVEIIDSSE